MGLPQSYAGPSKYAVEQRTYFEKAKEFSLDNLLDCFAVMKLCWSTHLLLVMLPRILVFVTLVNYILSADTFDIYNMYYCGK